MKSIIILIFTYLLTGNEVKSEPWVPVPIDNGTWLSYHHMFASIALGATKDIHSVFYGDSIIQDFDLAIWQRDYCPYGATNFGLFGEKVENTLWRIAQGESFFLNPKILVLMTGRNNILETEDSAQDIAQGVAEILRRLGTFKPNTKILLLGLIPTNEGPGFWDMALEVNDHLSQLSDGQKIFYLDMFDQFVEGSPGYGYVDPTIYRPDGIHLTKRGYQIWTESMLPVFQELWENSK